jgi:hypothetical protein
VALKKLDPDYLVETIDTIGDDDDGLLLLAEAGAIALSVIAQRWHD